MKEIVKESAETARVYFQKFGFEPEKIEPLLEAGKRDLEKELSILENLKNEEPFPLEEVEYTLHAIKGLLFNMGHNTAAEMINAVRIPKDDGGHEAARLMERLLR